MRERKKPSQSWMERTRYELEHKDELLAEKIEKLKDIRIKKLLYADSEAFKIGYEAGFAKACEMLHDFAVLVSRMRKKQWNADMISGEEDMDFIDMVFVEQREAEREVDTWIRENYPHLMED